MAGAPLLRVTEAGVFERPVVFRMPFRFGAAKVAAAPQAFVRLKVELPDGRSGYGYAAEMMMPKWFDKNPDLSVDDTVQQLRVSLHLALGLVQEVSAAHGDQTAFTLHGLTAGAHRVTCSAHGLNGLVASYGMALTDRAVLDALCRLHDLPVTEAIRTNLPGIDTGLTPDLEGFDLDGFLASLSPAPHIAVRHTVGLGDPLTEDDITASLDDGLPESLTQAIAAYGHRHFKLKVSGDVPADLDRLAKIAVILDALPDCEITLDGNEQFTSAEAVTALLDGLDAPHLAKLRARLLFLEQPIARAVALTTEVSALAQRIPLEIDESDAEIDSFVVARDLGYRGVSSKSCKGFYRALLNAARVVQWNDGQDGPYFLSAEELTIQPGMSLQQDLVLAALTGNAHVERNGHVFGDGMAAAPDAERADYLATYPALYRVAGDRVGLRITDGALDLSDVLAAKALGCTVVPADSFTIIPQGDKP